MASKRKTAGSVGKAPNRRLVRAARAEAEKVFGTAGAAKEWLGSECGALGFVRPIELLHDDEGLARVMTVLTRIDRGVFT